MARIVSGALVLLVAFSTVQARKRLVDLNVTPHADQQGFTIGGLDENQNLTLRKPSTPSLAFDFSFTVLDHNENGEPVFTDRTAEAREGAERPVYTDPESNAVLTVHEKNGVYRVHGVINGVRINHHKESGKHLITPVETKHPEKQKPKDDFVDLKIRLRPLPQTRTISTASPEVYVIFDYSNTQFFAGDEAKIKEYIAIFFHAVNNIYSRMADPKITLTVVGVLAVKSRTAQPFMEGGKIAISGVNAYDMSKVLEGLSKWMVANKASVPAHDVAALISGETFMSLENGQYSEGVAGLAYVGGACLTNANTAQGYRSLATSVNSDKRGFYEGVMTVAHELAHNFNSPHDGSGSSASCSWSLGYIMSYEGWGTRAKFEFSSCSKTNMKNFVNSQNGACLATFQSTTASRLVLKAGPQITLDQQCQKAMNNAGAKSYRPSSVPEADVCLQLICRMPADANGSFSYSFTGTLPLENSPCGTNKVCRNGNCV